MRKSQRNKLNKSIEENSEQPDLERIDEQYQVIQIPDEPFEDEEDYIEWPTKKEKVERSGFRGT